MPSIAPLNRSRALHWFAWFTTAAALLLICVGGLVTSHGAGMAVPDWPNTYGYNLFFFPFSNWVGGIFYEHTHRLVASGVGLLTTILALWLWRQERRSWLRWLGVAAFLAVLGQGILGGLRVTLLKDELGIVHATVAQLFLVLLAAIATLTSPRWHRPVPVHGPSARVCNWLWFTCGLVLAQLILGAWMRHQHAGLAIPDFPLAYGRWWPRVDPAALLVYNQNRIEVSAANPITAFQILLQMAHRIGAVAIMIAVTIGLRLTWRELGFRSAFTRGLLVWCGLVLIQATLGALTIWTGKAADIATAHVAVGAMTLVVGGLLALWSIRPRFSAGFATRRTSSPGAVAAVSSEDPVRAKSVAG